MSKPHLLLAAIVSLTASLLAQPPALPTAQSSIQSKAWPPPPSFLTVPLWPIPHPFPGKK